jgi:hypothetical protein
MLTVFGTHKAQYWNIIRRGANNEEYISQRGDYIQVKTCNLKQTLEDYCGKVLCCCMTEPIYILLKPSRNSRLM